MAVADFSRINNNIGALNALNSLNSVNKKLGLHQLRLATGRRINSAGDDPAGLTIATTFRQRNENLKTALDNIGDAKNLMSVAEAGLNKVQDILLEMRNKAEQAASDTLGSSERSAIQSQLTEYTKEINDIVDQTVWNGNKLLNGLTDFGNTITFQTGAEANETTTLSQSDFGSVNATNLGIGASAASASHSATGTGYASGSTTATSVVTSASTSISTSASAYNSQLDTGTYTVKVTFDAGSGGTSALIQLVDNAGNLVQFDSDNNGVMETTITGSFASGDYTASFGNGLAFTLGANDATAAAAAVGTGGTFSYTVVYSQSGTYNGSVTTASGAASAMTNLDTAIDTVSSRLQTLGANTSRLTFKEENLAEAQVNTEAAFNRIMNADMAMSQLEATKFQILQQTATAMLGQANQAPQALLSLFR